ncbi:MAG: motility associated factor glycosyltransferase family protein [Chlamydiales bacterium]
MGEVLCIYCEDPHASWERHATWLKEEEDRHLLFLHDEDAFPSLSLLTDPQLHFLSLRADDELIKGKLWELLFLSITYHADECKRDKAEEMFARIENLRAGIHLVASDYRDMGQGVLANLLRNFLLLSHAKEGSKLFEEFRGVPALICGAGPSLEKSLDEIRAWENRALLFAGGAALNTLSRFSIVPDFTAALDPHPLPERFSEIGCFAAPLFFQSRVATGRFSHVQGDSLWIAGNGGHPLESWMATEVGLTSDVFDAGWNVATFCAALARAMGCNPIIFVGLELSTQTEKVYAPGLDETIGKEFAPTLDVAGKKVYTKPDWQMAEKWLNQFVQDNVDHLFLNATEGGVALSSIPRLSLAEARERYGRKMRDLKGQVHSKVATLQHAASSARLLEVKENVQKSFKRCEELCIRLFTLFEKSYAGLPGMMGERALCEVELEGEIAYTTFLAPLWEIWRPLFLRQASMDRDLHRLLFFKRVFDEQRCV